MSRLDPDVVSTDAAPAPDGPGTSLLEPREVPLGGPRALIVRRTLPHKQIRTIGAWCFVDHFGPAAVAETGMHVPPHPHIGLQTVTWLYSGEVLHRDGLGSEQLVRPGELNLMTAGRGIAHAEDSVLGAPALGTDGTDGADGADGVDRTTMHGLQLWVALPDGERHQEPHFEHHAGLPTVDLPGATATVVLGTLGPAGAPDAVRSPAATYSPIVGVDLVLGRDAGAASPVTPVPLDPSFEHGLIPVEGDVQVDGVTVPRGALLHLPPGRDVVALDADGPARVFLLGGAPFGERLVMWWNFVGRDHDDIAAARADWEAERTAAPATGPAAGPSSGSSSVRFAPVTHPAPALPAPGLPTTRLLPR